MNNQKQNMILNLAATILDLAETDPTATFGQVYLAILAAEKRNLPTGLTRQSLNVTKDK